MTNYYEINYKDIEMPEKLLTSFAKALAPEIRKFYQSDSGKAYFDKWLIKHPEYKEDNPAAHSTKAG